MHDPGVASGSAMRSRAVTRGGTLAHGQQWWVCNGPPITRRRVVLVTKVLPARRRVVRGRPLEGEHGGSSEQLSAPNTEPGPCAFQ